MTLLPCTLYVICHFLLVVFNMLSLSLFFVNLITMCLGVFLLRLTLLRSMCFLSFVDYFLSYVREVFSYQFFKYFLRSFLSSPSGTPTLWMLVNLMLSQKSLIKTLTKVLILMILFIFSHKPSFWFSFLFGFIVFLFLSFPDPRSQCICHCQ